MTHKLSILLVEDEKNICDFISTSLSAQDYRISTAHTGKEALPIITSQCPDLILLDLGLPDMDGMEIIRQVRTWSSVPIIVLSARTQEQEKVRALDLGADDYLTKPYNPRELVARVKAVLRRTRPPGEDPRALGAALQCGDLSLDPERREVYAGDELVPLRTQEFAVLQVLMAHPGIVFDRERLLKLAWGFDFYGQTRTVDMHIAQLRKKLTGSRVKIETVPGVGYKLVS